jgi:hypothetical protein
LVARASFKAAEIIREHELENGIVIDPKKRLVNRTKLVWKLYIPAGVSSVFTVGSIVGANRIGSRKLLASHAALGVAQRTYAEYRDKVIEEIGEHKDRSIRDKIATEKVKENPPPSQDVLVTGPGNVLCCELFTGRYFVSDIEKIRRAVNQVNEKVLRDDYATLDDFYYIIGLRRTSMSNDLGWTSDKILVLTYTAVLTEDERPCIAFEYNYTKPV